MPTIEETIKQQFARTLTGKDWYLFKVFKAEQDGQMEEWYERTNPET